MRDVNVPGRTNGLVHQGPTRIRVVGGQEEPLTMVAIAAPNEMYRVGIRSLLSGLEGFSISGEAADTAGLIELLVAGGTDVVVLDPGIDPESGGELVDNLRTRAGDIAVLVLTDGKIEHIRQIIEAGAAACLVKGTEAQELGLALRLVAEGRHYIPADLVGPLLDRDTGAHGGRDLSQQQIAILRLVAHGLRNKQIAPEFDMSVTTLKSHLRIIYSRLGAGTRVEAVAAAVRLGIID